MFKKNKNWFTVVEIVVVITILVILSTIALVSYNWSLNSSRDTKRVSDLMLISNSLELFSKTHNNLFPLATTKTTILYISGSTLTGWYLQDFDTTLIDTGVTLNQLPVDPMLKSYYIYGVSSDYKKYEIASRLETNDNGQAVKTWYKLVDNTFLDNIYVVWNYRKSTINTTYALDWLIVFKDMGSGVLAKYDWVAFTGTSSTGSYIVVKKDSISYK